MDDYEIVLLTKPEVFVYKLPPLANTKGYKYSFFLLDNTFILLIFFFLELQIGI